MGETYTEVTRQGWFGRIGNSVIGALIGVVMTGGAGVLHVWNEGRSVKRYQDLKEGAGIVVTVPADRVDPENEGKLVHVTGTASTRETVADPEFGVSVPGSLKLRRTAEMFQWGEDTRTETRNKTGGGTEKVTVYDYDKKWSAKLERSADFHKPAGHENPSAMAFPSSDQVAKGITLGEFSLPDFFVSRINNFSNLTELSLDAVPEATRARLKSIPGGFYIGANPQSPVIGDTRVTFSSVPSGPVSLVGKQTGSGFDKYKTSGGRDLELLQVGTHSAQDLFASAEKREKAIAWAVRAGGFLLMAIGLSLIAQPLKVLADVIPIAGRIAGAGIGFVAFVMAGIGSAITISIGWISHRPLVAMPLLAVGALLLVWLVARMRKSKIAASTPPPL